MSYRCYESSMWLVITSIIFLPLNCTPEGDGRVHKITRFVDSNLVIRGNVESTCLELQVTLVTHIWLLCYYFGWEICWHNYCTMLNYETCLQLKMNKHYFKTWKISREHIWLYAYSFSTQWPVFFLCVGWASFPRQAIVWKCVNLPGLQRLVRRFVSVAELFLVSGWKNGRFVMDR